MGVDKEDDGGEGAAATGSNPNPNRQKSRKGKSCKGVLYYDSVLKLQSKEPICYGISESITQVPNYIVGETELEATKENRKLLKFKYSCAGYSVHVSNDSSTAPVEKQAELPYCIGLELLLDKRNSEACQSCDVNQKKEKDLAAFVNRPAAAKDFEQPSSELPTRTSRPSPPTPAPAPFPGGEVFIQRFTRNAKLVAASMEKNAHKVADRIKQSISDIVR